mmetsp:Transcript_24314/g.53227  ORF Transcript_24314/g.53227 Transcript_24314/m.53227 type:complete len:232 (-) Transcript_24314:107-802(-)
MIRHDNATSMHQTTGVVSCRVVSFYVALSHHIHACRTPQSFRYSRITRLKESIMMSMDAYGTAGRKLGLDINPPIETTVASPTSCRSPGSRATRIPYLTQWNPAKKAPNIVADRVVPSTKNFPLALLEEFLRTSLWLAIFIPSMNPKTHPVMDPMHPPNAAFLNTSPHLNGMPRGCAIAVDDASSPPPREAEAPSNGGDDDGDDLRRRCSSSRAFSCRSASRCISRTILSF